MMPRVLVLLSTYNGQKYIEELLDSVIGQIGVNVDILIRDDGSSDNTVKIIENKYISKYDNISLYKGKNLGYAKSFWNLISCAGVYDYYAFCDQDDVWLECKLAKAVNLIENQKYNGACLYTSGVISVDSKLNYIKDDAFKCDHILNIYESLQKSILPGCTFVFNNEAKVILSQYNGYIESHDWATYAIITLFGKVIYDEKSYIKYRIHEENTIGETKNKISDLKIKFCRLMKKSKCSRSKFARDLLEFYKDNIHDKSIYRAIKQLGCYKECFRNKIGLLFNKNFKGIIFRILVILNRV